MKKYLTLRVWVLIIFLVFALFAISPRPWATGIEVTGLNDASELALQGVAIGDKLISINGKDIITVADYTEAVKDLDVEAQNITVGTNEGIFKYEIKGSIGFLVNQNLTIIETDEGIPLEIDMQLESVNGEDVEDVKVYGKILDKLVEKKDFVLTTDKGSYALLLSEAPDMKVAEATKSNIQKGLELQGGSRVLLKPISESGEEVTDRNIVDLIDVLHERLNVYGLADITIRSASDLAGEKFVAVEIAGASREEVRELIAKQGVFEAKIKNEVVFAGGAGDIPFVCKGDGSCSGIIPPCNLVGPEQWSCTFRFTISLSPDAAARHARITDTLEVNASAGGAYLSAPLELYLDGDLRDSLNIAATLKGEEVTAISITGPGYGTTQDAAFTAATENMNKLQTVLISGSLPFELEIIKLDTISPALGEEFVNNAIFTGLLALLGVMLVIWIRYRRIKITIAVFITVISELFMTLGFAALIRWNLDIASIAGLVAAIGTGVDDQIVILDELVKGEGRFVNWKDRMKRAFGIIFAAYITLAAAMVPLWNAGAGLLRGFAVTTIVGITVGVFVTRPAFASIAEKIIRKE